MSITTLPTRPTTIVLEPCPWCFDGGDVEVLGGSEDQFGYTRPAKVICFTCEASTPQCSTIAEATATWDLICQGVTYAKH